MHGIIAKENPIAFIGISISIFLGFRNNAAWMRYSEARNLWGNLLITARSLVREIKNTTPATRAEILSVVHLLVSYCYALKSALRHESTPEIVSNCAPHLREQRNITTPCNALLLEIGAWLHQHRQNDLNYQNLNQYLNTISTIQGGCERISNTPIPFAYTLILHRTVYIFVPFIRCSLSIILAHYPCCFHCLPPMLYLHLMRLLQNWKTPLVARITICR